MKKRKSKYRKDTVDSEYREDTVGISDNIRKHITPRGPRDRESMEKKVRSIRAKKKAKK